jgi:glycosyltransferase involved in cell wall biosynthesis
VLDGDVLSVFTPSHNPAFLTDCFQSLEAQTFQDWEWVVLLNQGAQWAPPHADTRVRVVVAPGLGGVGAAKYRACAEARGEVLVELDHDDLLASNALQAIHESFVQRPGLALVYSHCAQILADGTRDGSKFNSAYGWQYREASVDGRDVQYPIAFHPTPHNVSYIWFAPNHVRAFSRAAYESSGGYDPARNVLDDHDLMCRLYAVGDFHLIDECLYLQRVHAANTQSEQATNAFIQTETVALYAQYIERNALAWASRHDLLALDLGAAHGRPDGYVGVDRRHGDDVDIVAELPAPLPLAAGSVGVIRAVDFLEHVADKVALFNEFYRLLAPGGLLLSHTPSTDGRGAFQDPTHVAFYNENSFWYFTEARYQAYVPDIEARFQVSRLVTDYPSEWHSEHDISYVTANLIALKESTERNGGPIFW